MTLLVRTLKQLPASFDNLRRDSLNQGFELLDRLATSWLDGTNRFTQPGERLLGAFDMDMLVGIGGLNQDPYLGLPGFGRVRHLYVHSGWRRQGIGAALTRELIAHAGSHFHTLILRTLNPEADRFYRALGFLGTTEIPSATHVLQLSIRNE